MRIISIGEILWDVYGDKEFVGGAPFNFSVHSRILGHKVYFISAIGDDNRGDRALQCTSDYGLSTKYISRVDNYPTGNVEVIKDKNNQSSFIIDNPAAYDFPSLNSEQIKEITSFQPDWLYFGTLQQMSSVAFKLTCKLFELLPKTKRFYDINLRAGFYSRKLILELLKASSILKLNSQETKIFCHLFNKENMNFKDFCIWVVNEFELEGVIVTMGAKGCGVYLNGDFHESEGCKVQVVDPVGAGDAFAASFIHWLDKKKELNKICKYSNKYAAKIVSYQGAIPK